MRRAGIDVVAPNRQRDRLQPPARGLSAPCLAALPLIERNVRSGTQGSRSEGGLHGLRPVRESLPRRGDADAPREGRRGGRGCVRRLHALSQGLPREGDQGGMKGPVFLFEISMFVPWISEAESSWSPRDKMALSRYNSGEKLEKITLRPGRIR